jgi:hypothetical protein
MAELYKDYLPSNANIIIDYAAKEKVRFSYPKERTYWQAVRQSAWPNVLTFWLVFNFKILVYFFIVLFVGFTMFVGINYSYYAQDLNFGTADISFLVNVFLITFYIAGVPLVVTYLLALNKKVFSQIMPIFGYEAHKMIASTRKKIFTIDDVHNNRVILPNYSNVYMHYNATEDFSKYLTKVEVMAIPFKSSKSTKEYKEEPDEYTFSAVFNFTQRPLSGNLEVEYCE